MAHLSAKDTLKARRKSERAAAAALAELAHVLMIDYLRGWNAATRINILMAEQAVQKACALDPSVALAHVVKGQISEVKGDLKSAIDAWEEALRLDPKLAIAYAHKANAKILQGQAEDALPLIEEAIKKASDPDHGLLYWFKGRAYFNMGASAKSRNEPGKASDWLKQSIDWLKQSLDKRDTTWFTSTHLISAYVLTGQLDEARAAIRIYRERFEADWPLENIIKYYEQPKYNAAPRSSEKLSTNIWRA
jgi:adenylate cyclase